MFAKKWFYETKLSQNPNEPNYSSGWSLPKRLFRLFQSKKIRWKKNLLLKNMVEPRTLYYISRSWVDDMGKYK
jgi:hypothetical protein